MLGFIQPSVKICVHVAVLSAGVLSWWMPYLSHLLQHSAVKKKKSDSFVIRSYMWWCARMLHFLQGVSPWWCRKCHVCCRVLVLVCCQVFRHNDDDVKEWWVAQCFTLMMFKRMTGLCCQVFHHDADVKEWLVCVGRCLPLPLPFSPCRLADSH